MNKLIDNLANLIKVKTLVTLAVITVFVVLALHGAISPDNVMIIISMVVSFYFGTQHEKTTTPGVPASRLMTDQIDTIPDTVTLFDGSAMDAATYNATHPDSVAELKCFVSSLAPTEPTVGSVGAFFNNFAVVSKLSTIHTL